MYRMVTKYHYTVWREPLTTTREPEITFHEMMVAIGVVLSSIARSDDRQDGDEEDDEETE
jgi:hypothetical protein